MTSTNSSSNSVYLLQTCRMLKRFAAIVVNWKLRKGEMNAAENEIAGAATDPVADAVKDATKEGTVTQNATF